MAHRGIVMLRKAFARVAARPLGQAVDPHVALEPAFELGGAIVLVFRDVHGARDADLHRVEDAAARLGIAPELRDERDDVLGQIVLSEQEIVAAPRDLGDGAFAAGAHPERRMRPLRRRRLDDDVVVLPVMALMAERRVVGEGLRDDR